MKKKKLPVLCGSEGETVFTGRHVYFTLAQSWHRIGPQVLAI